MVPESAVIDAGDRKLVFVDRGEGRFEPREVTARRQARGRGLPRCCAASPRGERVVTAANFLLDSESSLKAALSVHEVERRRPGDAAAEPGHKH